MIQLLFVECSYLSLLCWQVYMTRFSPWFLTFPVCWSTMDLPASVLRMIGLLVVITPVMGSIIYMSSVEARSPCINLRDGQSWLFKWVSHGTNNCSPSKHDISICFFSSNFREYLTNTEKGLSSNYSASELIKFWFKSSKKFVDAVILNHFLVMFAVLYGFPFIIAE